MVDLPNEVDIVDILKHDPEAKLLVASNVGNGFVVAEKDIIAQTRSGKQVLNVKDGEVAKVAHRIKGDHVAVISQNRRFLVFPISEVPEMGRGKGVRLQKYVHARGAQGMLELDGGLSDLTTFVLEEGLSWTMGGGNTRTEKDIGPWLGKRAGVGKQPPHGFPRDNTFS